MPTFTHNNIKRIINIDTGDVYKNLIEAGDSIKKSSKLIGMCCRKKNSTAGGYHWMYYDDYLNSAYEEIEKIKSANTAGKGRRKKVICIEINLIYESTCHASKETGICQTSIAKACSGKQLTAGGYHWKYHEMG